MSGRWFHNEGDQIIGPVTLDEVESYLLAHFGVDVMVWTDGMASWEPARTVPAFDALYREPPPLPLPDAADEAQRPEVPPAEPPKKEFIATPPPLGRDARPSGGETPPPAEGLSVADPWLRFAARAVDLAVYYSFFAFLIGFPVRSLGLFEVVLFSMLSTLGYCFVEAIVTGVFGTTIGKWVFSIMIAPSVTWTQAWDRAFSIWVRGLGLGIPFVCLFTLASSHWDVVSTGKTAWDRDHQSHVVQLRMRFWRWVAFIAGSYAVWWVIKTRGGV